jgi:hypothetical protein
MTLDDLCAALLPFDHRPESDIPSMKQQPPAFFKKIDIDKNGLIDYGEYLLFVTLLGRCSACVFGAFVAYSFLAECVCRVTNAYICEWVGFLS